MKNILAAIAIWIVGMAATITVAVQAGHILG